MGFNSAFKGLKLLKKTGNGRLNNLNDPVLNVLMSVVDCAEVWCVSSATRADCTLGCQNNVLILGLFFGTS